MTCRGEVTTQVETLAAQNGPKGSSAGAAVRPRRVPLGLTGSSCPSLLAYALMVLIVERAFRLTFGER